MLGRVLKMTFWVTYDHLGKLILANVVWALAVSIPGAMAWAAFLSPYTEVQLLLGAPLALLTVVVLLPVTSVGLVFLAKELIETRDGSVRLFFRGMRLYGGRAIGLGALYSFASVTLATSTWFYASKLRESVPLLGYALSSLALWFLVFAGVTAILVLPTLVQKKSGVLQTVKLTALLVLDNPVLSLGLVINLAALTVLCGIFAPFFFFLYGAVAMVLASSTYEMLARKYAALEAAEQGETAARVLLVGPDKRTVILDEEEDDYLNRGLRDALFPWKGER
jgi:hypothetical protein